MNQGYQFFAVTPMGVEGVAAEELEGLAAHGVEVQAGGVGFSGSLDLMYRVNLRARTVTRVLLRLASFKALSFPELYNKSRKIDWSQFFDGEAAVQVHAAAHASKLIHTGRISETVAAALRDVVGAGSVGDKVQNIYVRFEHDQCTVSLDCSGERLDRRGYRLQPGAAPLRETMAAALLQWAGWRGGESLMVPMCGSGTFAIEAAGMATHMAANLSRSFPFESWPCSKAKRWQRAKEKAAGMQRRSQLSIHASDIDEEVLNAARANAARAGVEALIGFEKLDVHDLMPVGGPGLLMLNPPYGERIGHDAPALYAEIGRLYRQRFAGWRMVVMTPDAACERALGLRPAKRLTLKHGGARVHALSFG